MFKEHRLIHFSDGGSEPGVSTTGGEPVPPPAAQPPANPTNGDDPANPVPPGSGEPPANGEPPPSQTSGYDALPQYGKDIIARQSEAKNAEKARADAAEAELARLKGHTPAGGDTPPVPSDDLAEQKELFNKLARENGWKSPEEVQQMVNEEFARRDQAAADAEDEKELNSVLEKFDGKELPAVTKDELKVYLETIQYDPNLRYLASAPWEVIVRTMKADAIRELNENKVLAGSGGKTPPEIATPGEAPKAPEGGIPRYDNLSQMKAGIYASLGVNN